MEIAEKAKDNRLTVVMTTVLVALLLISQLSLASGNTNSRFILDNNYGSLESNVPESNDNDINIFTPDFLDAITEQVQPIVFQWADNDFSLTYNSKHTQHYPIRGPPQIS